MIDCGTAITVNALDENNKCLGGIIFSGPRTQSIALAEHTSDLYETDLIHTKSIIANSTKDALNNGIIFSTAYSVLQIIDEFENSLGKSNIIFTGGAFRYIKEVLDSKNLKYAYIPN